MQQAANNAAELYRSWRQYLAAYVIGRALGFGNSSGDIYKVLEYLLNNEESPFNKNPYKHHQS